MFRSGTLFQFQHSAIQRVSLKYFRFLSSLGLVLLNLPALGLSPIPTFSWQRDINGSGYTDGAPIGGFGAGTITWKNNGNFSLARLNIGASTITEAANTHFYFYQKPAGSAATSLLLNAATL